MAIGSDDQSKIWVNDQLIWQSVASHKAWNMAEGYRKVFFKKGRNRILCRLENGHLQMGVSLVICTLSEQ